MDTSVICVLNVFNRPQWFQEQLAAIKNQTVKPKKIIIWNNNDSINLNMFKSDPQILILSTSQKDRFLIQKIQFINILTY